MIVYYSLLRIQLEKIVVPSIEPIEGNASRNRMGSTGRYTSAAMNIRVAIDDISGKDRQ